MDKKILEDLLSMGLSHGASFCETFEESTIQQVYNLKDSKLKNIDVKESKGIGIRLANSENKIYGCTNDLDIQNVQKLMQNLNQKFSGTSNSTVELPALTENTLNYLSNHQTWTEEQKKEYLQKIDHLLRQKCKEIIQVDAKIIEEDSEVTIANNLGTYQKETRMLSRLVITALAKKKEKTANHTVTLGKREGYSYFDTLNINDIVDQMIASLTDKLKALPCPGKKMPVILGPGFGAVIFHEACGHALEATSIAPKISVLSNKLGEKIASEKVTLIDDGTIENAWGSTKIDDEGTPTQKNILIENGILKSYLVDCLNAQTMNHPKTGSGRRESYQYAPTSRMNNTYLEKGNDSISDMIQSISYGLYAKGMGGGCVEPSTGDFTFFVSEGYLIENGQITTPVKGASLIGNTKDILFQIEMVSDDLSLDTGYCGSLSGYVPVTIGEPTIKVSEILVGGAS